MSIKRYYGGAIWTDHAMERLADRKMPQSIAILALKNPDQVDKGKKLGTDVYIKNYFKNGVNYVIKIVLGKNEKGERIVVSTWVDPPFAGSVDIKKQRDWRNYKKAGFLGKIFYLLKRQLGF